MWWNKLAGRALVFLLVAFSSHAVLAQADSTLTATPGSHHLYFHSCFDLNATTLTNEFINTVYQGGDLSRDLRTRNSDRLKNNNIAGYSLDGGLYYFFAPDKFRKKVGYYIGIEEHTMSEIRFRQGFYDLLFFGNDAFTGSRVHFNNMKLVSLSYQQIKAGIFKTIHRKGKVHQLGLALGLNIGQKNTTINVNRGSLYTAGLGEYVALDVDMEIQKTDSNRNGIGAFNGYGASVDLHYNFSDVISNEVQVRLSNLGYIRWDRTPENFHRDTTIRYDGFDVDIFNLNTPLFSENFGDSLLSEIIGSDRQTAYASMLPLDLHLTYTHYFGRSGFSLTIDAREKFFSLYRPWIMLKPGYRLPIKRSSLSFYPLLSAGGYGSWNAGLELSAQIGRSTFLSIGSPSLNALFFPKNSAGLSVGVTLYQSLNK